MKISKFLAIALFSLPVTCNADIYDDLEGCGNLYGSINTLMDDAVNENVRHKLGLVRLRMLAAMSALSNIAATFGIESPLATPENQILGLTMATLKSASTDAATLLSDVEFTLREMHKRGELDGNISKFTSEAYLSLEKAAKELHFLSYGTIEHRKFKLSLRQRRLNMPPTLV